jgi:hypothetical protein
LLAESFFPAEVAILGDVDYGGKSAALACRVANQKSVPSIFNA